MKVLIVKLSSLGDVVHTLPSAADIRLRFPDATIDWVVESAFSPIIERTLSIDSVISCNLRSWRKNFFSFETWKEWRIFIKNLQKTQYDAVIDLQGLTKSGLIAWYAKVKPNGKKFAMANRTLGSSFETPTRWPAHFLIGIDPHTSAVKRARLTCAKALGYEVPQQESYGINLKHNNSKKIMLVHGTSRKDKEWPIDSWIEICNRLNKQGFKVFLPHGNSYELIRSEKIAARVGNAYVMPLGTIDEVIATMVECFGVVGVDSGLSHIAVALNLPHVQIYNFPTAWRTGPIGKDHQISVGGTATPSVDEVWSAWQLALSHAPNK